MGSMTLDMGNYSGQILNNNVGAYIAPNERHCFSGSQNNLFLVIDLTAKSHRLDENLTPHLFPLTERTKKFIQFTHHYLTHHERDFFTDTLVNQLLFHFATSSFSPEPDLTIMKAKEWIDLYFTEPVQVSKVARHCHLSISQLQRRFKQAIGCGIAEYWRMKKLQQAKWLLSVKQISIETIAHDIGYENVSAFSRRFSHVFGESPTQWRNKMLSAKKMLEKDN
jgi:AraC-like DNA-binding protein